MDRSSGFGSARYRYPANWRTGYSPSLSLRLPPYLCGVKLAIPEQLTGSFFNRHAITRPQGENFQFNNLQFTIKSQFINDQTKKNIWKLSYWKFNENWSLVLENSCPTDKLWLFVSRQFQVLFHWVSHPSFNLSLTVLVHYRSFQVFSLGVWSPQLHPGVCRLLGYSGIF